MINLNDYLPVHHEQASKEALCVGSCLLKVDENLHKGDFTAVREALIDATKSVNELEKLHQHKQANDKLAELAHLMTRDQIPLQSVLIIRRG